MTSRWRPQNDPVTDHGDAVWRAVVRVLGDADEDAADCFQQAFVELADRQRRGKAVANPGALLKHIAVMRAIDCIRGRMRDRSTRVAIEADALCQTPRGDDTAELLADLRKALADLPPRQAAAFVLTQIEDESHESAAASIGVTVSHLNVLLHRARAALRERLESYKLVREARS